MKAISLLFVLSFAIYCLASTQDPISGGVYQCSCFPPQSDLRQAYYEYMTVLSFQIEAVETFPILDFWLSGECVEEYKFVASRAVNYYVHKVCEPQNDYLGETPCTAAHIDREELKKTILSFLESMAIDKVCKY